MQRNSETAKLFSNILSTLRKTADTHGSENGYAIGRRHLYEKKCNYRIEK